MPYCKKSQTIKKFFGMLLILFTGSLITCEVLFVLKQKFFLFLHSLHGLLILVLYCNSSEIHLFIL